MKRIWIVLIAVVCGLMFSTTSKANENINSTAEVRNLRITNVTKESIKMEWDSSKDITGYTVYSYNPKTKKYKKINTIKKKTYTVKKGMKKDKVSYFAVRAYKKNGGNTHYGAYSKTVSICPKGSKKKNVRQVVLSDSSFTVEEGATFKISKKIVPRKNLVSKRIFWRSSNSKIIDVDSQGTMKANGKGHCTITATAHNGVSSEISIWVLDKEYAPKVRRIKKVENIKIHAISNNALKLSWKKCKHVSGYKIYIYDVATRRYIEKKIIKGNKKSTIISGLKKNVNYSFRIKGYYDKKGIKIYGSNSACVSGCVNGGRLTNATSIQFGQKEYQVMEGNQLDLGCAIEPANTISKVITYTSSCNEVATVSTNGVVTGNKQGKAYITARAHNGLSARVLVRVIQSDKSSNAVSILCFHRIVSDNLKKNCFANNQWVASISDFEKQMKYLYDNHYNTVSLDEFYDWYSKKKDLPSKTVVLTFDDGDYEFYYLVYPVLKKYGLKATMFIVGNRTNDITYQYEDTMSSYYLGWDCINEMKTNYPNISFQSHTYNMHYIKGNNIAVKTLTLPQIYEDFEINKLNGIKYKNSYSYIAYPYGGCVDDVLYCEKKYGFKMAFDFGNGRKATREDNCYHIPRIKINGQITIEDFIKKI